VAIIRIKHRKSHGGLKCRVMTTIRQACPIALLRAANIPAKYACGTIELPIERVMSRLGVEDETTAANIIASDKRRRNRNGMAKN